MTTQGARASSIIIALTDGKLEVYPHDLAVKEVKQQNTYTEYLCCVSNGSIYYVQIITCLKRDQSTLFCNTFVIVLQNYTFWHVWHLYKYYAHDLFKYNI